MCEADNNATDSDCYEDAYEEVELVKVQHPRVVHVQHVKHRVDLVLAQIRHGSHEHKELDVCKNLCKSGSR